MTRSTGRAPCVLLISPGIIKWTDQDFGLPHLVSIGGVLQRELGLRVELLDLNYEGGDHRQLERTLDQLAPFLVVGLSCYSSFDLLRVRSIAQFIKRLYPQVPLVSGGYHASAVPEDLVFEGSPFDAVVLGEGELPMLELARELLGQGRLERTTYGPRPVPELDWLPPYQWQLLDRYWPRAQAIGRKLQIYLSRGCPHRCTFCMERAKGEGQWRALGAERAVDELRRLDRVADLGQWVVNIGDPLFGHQRRWRREVLGALADHGPRPRLYWTLTRAEGLEQQDVELLARARFAIGVGLESGSERMLRLMRKTNNPARYLAAMEQLAAWSRTHGLTWAANLVVGHPGETPRSMEQTRDFLRALCTAEPQTRGWFSVDPFRLYPGSEVQANLGAYERQHGARFYHPRWWHRWYDASFCAEHVDPSAELDFAARVRFVHDHYRPLLQQVAARFVGQGRAIDRVFRGSIDEQVELHGPAARDRELARADWLGGADPDQSPQVPQLPLGLHVRDEAVRRREDAVRRLLQRGVLRAEALVEALLSVAPERYMDPLQAQQMLLDQPDPGQKTAAANGAPQWLAVSTYALALEALAPRPGQRVADLLAVRGYLAALLAQLVGPRGEVLACCPGSRRDLRRLRRELQPLDQVEPRAVGAADFPSSLGSFDSVVLGAALPRLPVPLAALLRHPAGRCVTALGPRFRPQDLVCVTRRSDGLTEHRLARVQLPAIRGPQGWVS